MSGLSESDTSTPAKRVREPPTTPSAYTSKKMKGLQRTPQKPSSASTSTPNDGGLAEAIRKLTSSIETMSSDVQQLRVDFNTKFDGLSAAVTSRFEKWEEEKAVLVNNQTELMNRIDQLERNQKRPNIVVTGLERDTELSARETVEQLFREKVSDDIVVASAYKINMKNGSSKFIATMRSVEDKITVMKGKAKLLSDGGKKVFVADDLIKKDEFVQFQARSFAKKMSAENKEAKVAFKRVYVDNVAHIWDENSQTFVNRKN